MKRILGYSWCLVLLLALPVWGAEPQVVIMPFQNSNERTTDTGLETALQDLLIASLSRAQSVTVLDRDHLNRILKEHHSSLGGLVDEAAAVKTGKLIGADFIVLGSFTLTGGQLHVQARAVSVNTTVISAAQEITAASSELIKIGDQLTARLLETLQLKSDKLNALPVDPAPEVNLCFLRGVAFFLSAQYDSAQEQFLKARQLNPRHFDALFWGARCYLEQKQYAHARIEFDRFLKLAGNHPQMESARRYLSESKKNLTADELAFLDELVKSKTAQ